MNRRRPPLSRSLALAFPLVLLAVTVSAYAPSAHAAASDFPPGYQGYHTYAEVAADVAATAAAHPDIVQRFSIGASYQGRQMWAVKISDNVTVDENEPEVLFDGGTHSDEHMGVEMTLKIMHWLVDGYATDPRIKKIVDTREIWIIFIVNPDGVEYDIANRKFHFWRKNRQPTPGSRYIGTDLNRNFRYHWGGGGMTSSNPAAGTYRGPYAFSAPETQHMRDFLASRVVNGRQQVRVAMTFHESGRLVMWPYGYTLANVPYDMTLADHGALVTMGRAMAATNGYKPEQASDLYVSSGTTRDYEYGVYRIFAYTFELSVVAYPRDTLIASETGRNRAAVLYLLERAWCPLAVLGTAVRDARCGAFDDDLEVARGWAVNPDGTDTAPVNARFVRSNPAPTYYLGVKQRGDTTSGSMAFVTGALAGSSANANDLDGVTTIRSVPITLPAKAGQRLTFRYVFAHDARSTSADSLKAIVETSGGAQTVVFTRVGSPTDVDGVWRSASVAMDAYAGQTVRLRFEATDGGVNNLVEAEIDDVRITYGQ